MYNNVNTIVLELVFNIGFYAIDVEDIFARQFALNVAIINAAAIKLKCRSIEF